MKCLQKRFSGGLDVKGFERETVKMKEPEEGHWHSGNSMVLLHLLRENNVSAYVETYKRILKIAKR